MFGKIIHKRGLTPENAHLVSQCWPWPIRVITLGGFELMIHDSPFSYSGRAPKKILDLLKLLITSGKKGIHETPIQDALWPEMDGDRAHNIFSTTLHRLRKILGNEKAISFTLGKVSLNEKLLLGGRLSFPGKHGTGEYGHENGKSSV